MIDIALLERLYKSYGFEVSKEAENTCTFLYRKSRYFGVDIILLKDDAETQNRAESIKAKYSQIGYAVNQKFIRNNDEAEIELFKSFFSFDTTIERLKRKFTEFKNKQVKSLFGNEYKYVEGPFEIQNSSNNELGIFEMIQQKFASADPELIIIEAAAGYGKTCTAYELINRTTFNPTNQIPIFTELSRNRGAKIFRYILLDEIDLEYASLSSELVIKEIKNGRIPLIIDGFDELLEKVNIDSNITDAFEEVETMLDTIGNLLEYKSKIILTTRKTAIFTGLEFEAWVHKWENKFNITRISLKEPRLKDWLGDNKFALVKEKGVPIQYLANPVILTFLKNIDFEMFTQLMEGPEMLVEHYFEKMLEREKERQNLIMPVSSQLDVFRNVVKMLIDLDSTVEDKDFFKEIILDQNKKLLEYTRSLYHTIEKPSINNLVDSLAAHALLDRKGRDQSQIGFINDFVFGTLIGQVMSDATLGKIEKDYSSYMIELAVTAFRVQSTKVKSLLWEKLQHVLHKFKTETIFAFDIYLKNKLQRSFTEIAINDLTFFNILFTDHSITSSVFANCYFKNCEFDICCLQSLSFINCTFDNCRVAGSMLLDDRNEITAIKCKEKRCRILVESSQNSYAAEKLEIVTEFEKEVLQKLYNISYTKGHHVVKLINCFAENKKKLVSKSLKTLEEKGFITVSGIHVYFVMNRIYLIKEILEIPHYDLPQ